MDNKKAHTYLTAGLIVRLIAAFIDIVSLPFLILNPSNTIAVIIFGFGNFLLIVGGVMD